MTIRNRIDTGPFQGHSKVDAYHDIRQSCNVSRNRAAELGVWDAVDADVSETNIRNRTDTGSF